MNIALESILAKLPIMKIQASIQSHGDALMKMMPDKRMKKALENMLLGILGGQTPLITGMACQNGKTEGETWAVAKSIWPLKSSSSFLGNGHPKPFFGSDSWAASWVPPLIAMVRIGSCRASQPSSLLHDLVFCFFAPLPFSGIYLWGITRFGRANRI